MRAWLRSVHAQQASSIARRLPAMSEPAPPRARDRETMNPTNNIQLVVSCAGPPGVGGDEPNAIRMLRGLLPGTPDGRGSTHQRSRPHWMATGAPPRARGSTVAPERLPGVLQGSPARTGIIRSFAERRENSEGFPRAHGEQDVTCEICGAELGISPRARGARTAGTRRGRTRPDELQREQLTGRRQKGRIDTWRTGSPTGPRTRRSSWP